MRISDWSSDVCSSDLGLRDQAGVIAKQRTRVQTVDIVPRNNRLGEAEAIRADDLASLRMPEKQVLVMWIDAVQSARQTTAFPPYIGRASCRERVCTSV